MSSRQYFPKMHERDVHQHSSHTSSGAFGARSERPGSEQQSPAEWMTGHYPTEQWGALFLLGLARLFEWQAAAGHVAISEWSRQQQEWLATVVEMEYGMRHFGLSRSHLERMFDVVRLWGLWGVTTQLATAQGLVSSCSPQSLGLPANSGRRAGFDLGRRTPGAIVIDFPDRRRAGERVEN